MSDSRSIFEVASRMKLRFPSNKGELLLEMLWDMPLESRSGFSLDAIAQSIAHDLQQVSQGSFIRTSKVNREQEILTLKLDIVKHIIDVLQKEADDVLAKTARAEQKKRIQEILANRQDNALKNMPEEDLKKMLAEM